MNKNILLPIIVSLLALAFIDPFMYWMPSNSNWLLIGGLMLATSIYGFFVITEKANDEREVTIRAFADRISCLVGMSFLVMMIGWQAVTGSTVSSEAVMVLVILVISKSLAHWYAHNKM